MFHHFIRPFPSFITEVDPNTHLVLAWISPRRSKLLIQDLSAGTEVKELRRSWFECCAFFLNHSPCLECTKLILRSIQETIKKSEAQRASDYIPRPAEFRADFGRRDFERPGQGGSGIDGYW